MYTIINRRFWMDAIIRAVRTMAQTAVGVIGTGAAMSDVNWGAVFSSSVLAGIVSILMTLDRLEAAQNGKEVSDHDSA